MLRHSVPLSSSLFEGRFASWRSYSTLFDVNAKSLQKARAALLPDADKYDYIRNHIAAQLVDRLHDISRPFPKTLDLFCGNAHFFRAFNQFHATTPTLSSEDSMASKIERLYHTDVHEVIIRRASSHFDNRIASVDDATVFKEGQNLPFEEESLDAVVSSGALHWVNDLPGMLRLISSKLRPDGVFLGSFFGGHTLQELRICLQEAEHELMSRVAPRTSPTVHIRDAARLLTAANFTLPAADVDRFVISHGDMWGLMRHLRAMGEGNALHHREHWAGRKVFERASQIYAERFPCEDGNGIIATFEVIYVIGWKCAPRQPIAARRGSAASGLSDLASSSK